MNQWKTMGHLILKCFPCSILLSTYVQIFLLLYSEQVLENSYLNSLKLMKENNLRTVAFPSISTGIYGFPHVSGSFNPANDWFSLYSVLVLYSLFFDACPIIFDQESACNVALRMVRYFLERNKDSLDKVWKREEDFFSQFFQVIFCLYQREDEAAYRQRVHIMFPVET